MKQLLLLSFIFVALANQVHAAPVSAYATNVETIYAGNFSLSVGGSTLDDAGITSAITSDPNVGIFGASTPNYSAIDLSFGDTTAFTGDGADIVISSLWSGFNYIFALEVFNSSGTSLSSYMYSVSSADCTSPCSTETSINLFHNDDTDTQPATLVEDGIELGIIRLWVGGSDRTFTNDEGIDVDYFGAYSNVSLAGAIYSDAEVTPVPLPLPVVLFASGLTLLGFAGRRRKS